MIFRFKFKQLGRSRFIGVILIAVLFAGWETMSRLSIVDANYFPPVSAIGMVLYKLSVSFEIIGHLLTTLKRVTLGFLLGASIGYSLGFFCGYLPRIYSFLELSIEFLRPMPSIALIPVGILFLGLGDKLNVAIIGWACCWPVFINTMDGVRSTDSILMNTARTFGLNRMQTVRKVIVPYSLPFVFTGLRVSLGIAVAVVVITEMVASGSGLGFFIISTSVSFRVSEMYAGIIVIGVFGYLLNRMFLAAHRYILKWHIGFLCLKP